MPSKYRIILEMASQTARDIASNADRYTDFLITAANNYKYSFKEQLLIHAQNLSHIRSSSVFGPISQHGRRNLERQRSLSEESM